RGGYQGTVRVELVPPAERRRSESEITAQLLDKLDHLAGTEIKEVQQDPLSPEGENGLIVQIFGYEPQQKQQLATVVKQKMQDIAHIVNVSSSADQGRPDPKSTRLNSSHVSISYAVFCLKKKHIDARA